MTVQFGVSDFSFKNRGERLSCPELSNIGRKDVRNCTAVTIRHI